MLKIHTLFLQDISLIINQHSFLFKNSRELTETYRSCLAKAELLVCIINHDQVSAEQKLGLTKVRPHLFLMLINPIAPTLTVPNRTVIPLDMW